MARKKSLSVQEALALLEELSDDEEFINADIVITPPTIGYLTDEDSGPEDILSVDNLCGSQLRASATVKLKCKGADTKVFGESSSENDDEEIIPPKKCKKKNIKREWRAGDLVRQIPKWTEIKPKFLTIHWSPTSLFQIFFDDDLIELIQEQSILYAQQKGCMNFRVTREELRTFIAILLTSGYAELPRRRLYWDPSADVNNAAISSSMSRNRFEKILQYLHFADNNKLNVNDKISKLRPFLSMLNEKFLLYFPMEQELTVDESMVPYYGRHSCKQFIKSKPIRFGYKVWALNTRLGYLVQFEPYQGAGTVPDVHGVGMGGSVVLDLISELPANKPFDIYFDNLFTSPALIDELSSRNIGATGTIRINRTEDCPLENVKLFKKRNRGSYEHYIDDLKNCVLVRWRDNNVVTIGSNMHGILPIVKAKRWSSSEKKIIEIDQPNIICQYNRCMGGTDRMDQNLNAYRCSIRSKKWWWPLFVFGLESAIQNAWHIYRLCPSASSKPLHLLSFRREICLTYFKQSTNNMPGPGRPVTITRRCKLLDSVRYDGLNHYIEVNKTQIRCGNCGKKVTRKCSKCNIGLHEKCFKDFHEK